MNQLENMIVGLNVASNEGESLSEIGGVAGPENLTTETKLDIKFQPKNFVKNTRYMGAGMLGIFVVIGLIIIVTGILNRVTSAKKKD